LFQAILLCTEEIFILLISMLDPAGTTFDALGVESTA